MQLVWPAVTSHVSGLWNSSFPWMQQLQFHSHLNWHPDLLEFICFSSASAGGAEDELPVRFWTAGKCLTPVCVCRRRFCGCSWRETPPWRRNIVWRWRSRSCEPATGQCRLSIRPGRHGNATNATATFHDSRSRTGVWTSWRGPSPVQLPEEWGRIKMSEMWVSADLWASMKGGDWCWTPAGTGARLHSPPSSRLQTVLIQQILIWKTDFCESTSHFLRTPLTPSSQGWNETHGWEGLHLYRPRWAKHALLHIHTRL